MIFINMDYNSEKSEWWVEYLDDNNETQIDIFSTEEEAQARYLELT